MRTPGGNVSLPAGFSFTRGETIIVTEVVYDYTPWLFSGFVGSTRNYEMALHRPRYGGLAS